MSCLALKVSKRYAGFLGSSMPTVGSITSMAHLRTAQRMTCLSVLYAFSAAPGLSKASTHSCMSSCAISETARRPKRGSTWQRRADS